ncbi:Adenosylhomocysteinase [Streptomyces misionensis JCM 4497]
MENRRPGRAVACDARARGNQVRQSRVRRPHSRAGGAERSARPCRRGRAAGPAARR